MNLLEILQKELTEFPEGMLYAVQDKDGEVKFGKHSNPTLWERGIWQRHEEGNYLTFPRLELAEDWDSAIVTKDMWENDRVKQIIVNVSGLSVEEKQRVNEALAKITGATKLPAVHPYSGSLFAPDSSGRNMVSWTLLRSPATLTHTPQQVLEMAKQGHPHADLIMEYAEVAQTNADPHLEFEYLENDGTWHTMPSGSFFPDVIYRRKPITIYLNGEEIPIFPNHPYQEGDTCYYVTLFTSKGFEKGDWNNLTSQREALKNNLIYPYTPEGREACIKHSKTLVRLSKGGQHEDPI